MGLARRFGAMVPITLAFIAASAGALSAQAPGAIIGQVTDAETGAPLSTVEVRVQGAQIGAITGDAGRYVIRDVPPGSYVLTFRVIGYAPRTRTDVIVDPGRTAQADAALRPSAVELGAIVVNSGYFPADLAEPVSRIELTSEEVRRAPGSAGDISRVLFAMPSTAHFADNANDLIVRGGAPFENGFYIDYIEVPNINHFPVVGSSGGPIGLVNVEYIDDVAFSAGGFSAAYGDRLSSIVDIDFRDGAGESVQARGEVSMAGFGASLEGPAGESTTWFVSARRSFLDLIVDAIGTGVAPQYGDLHAKASLDLDANNTLSFLGLFGLNEIASAKADSEEQGNPVYGATQGGQGTVGATWRHVWNGDGYSVHALSVSGIRSNDDYLRTASDDTLIVADYLEAAVRYRNVNRAVLGVRSILEFGAELELDRADYDYTFGSVVDRLGNTMPAVRVDRATDGVQAAAFASHTWTVTPRWDVTTGLRADWFSAPGAVHISPRFSTAYSLGERTTLNAAAGVYHQRLSSFLLSQDPAFESLPAPRAVHAVLGLDYLLTEETQLSLEVYDKEYDRFPMEVEDPTLFVVDQGTSASAPRGYRTLVAEGRARSYGAELLIQKKLARDLYGLVSGAWFRTRYQDLNGVWRDRQFDNRYVFSAVGGYRPSHRWEMSARWSYAGGAPYTPFDVAASTAASAGVIDSGRLLSERYPAYHTLNLRIDRRWVFEGSALTMNLSIWNAYNRENIALYYWDEIENAPGQVLQWSFFPILGLEWEF